MNYFEELKRTMTWLGQQPNVIFIGQAVEYPGTAMYNTLVDIPNQRKLELPVFENTQLGMSIGMGIYGIKCVSIYPRWNFLVSAADQLINHLDKIGQLYGPTPIIIRTAVASDEPLNPREQHLGDFTDQFNAMCPNIEFVKLTNANMIFPAYECAYYRNDKPTVIVEYAKEYNT